MNEQNDCMYEIRYFQCCCPLICGWINSAASVKANLQAWACACLHICHTCPHACAVVHIPTSTAYLCARRWEIHESQFCSFRVWNFITGWISRFGDMGMQICERNFLLNNEFWWWAFDKASNQYQKMYNCLRNLDLRSTAGELLQWHFLLGTYMSHPMRTLWSSEAALRWA